MDERSTNDERRIDEGSASLKYTGNETMNDKKCKNVMSSSLPEL